MKAIFCITSGLSRTDGNVIKYYRASRTSPAVIMYNPRPGIFIFSAPDADPLFELCNFLGRKGITFLHIINIFP